jgi:hypothetical protein
MSIEALDQAKTAARPAAQAAFQTVLHAYRGAVAALESGFGAWWSALADPPVDRRNSATAGRQLSEETVDISQREPRRAAFGECHAAFLEAQQVCRERPYDWPAQAAAYQRACEAWQRFRCLPKQPREGDP